MKLRRWILVGAGSGILLLVAWLTGLPDRRLHLVFCDVGQGDAILVSQGKNQVLIDGGPDDKVIDCLSEQMPFWDREIELVVLTHPEADHLSGLIEVFRRYAVGKFMVNGINKQTAVFTALAEAVAAEGCEVYLPRQGDEVSLGELSLEVVWPKERLGSGLVWSGEINERVLGTSTYKNKLNESSIVLGLHYREFEAWLIGDIGQDTEQALVGMGALTEAEVLKVGHHGSKYSSSLEFLRQISPELAIISVGEKNSFGHPTDEVLMRLESVGAKIYRTDETGEVEIVSDGASYWVD